MSFEAILIFIVIAIFSSLGNRNKNQKQKQQRRQRTDEGSKPMPPNISTQNNPQRTTKKRKNLLEEMLEQYDLADPRKNTGKKNMEAERNNSPEKERVVEQEKIDPKKHITSSLKHNIKKGPVSRVNKTSRKKKRDKNSIYGAELTEDVIAASSVETTEIGLSFNELVKVDQQSLVKAIIMAEVLGKPKSMQR